MKKDRDGRFMKVFMNIAPWLLAALAIFALIYMMPQFSHAADVALQWDANTESNLAGYKVYYGTASRNYTSSVNVGNWTSCTISGLTAGKTYYFSASAYNTAGLESGYATEVAYTVPGTVTPPPPTSTGGSVAFATNAGGTSYTTAAKVAYQADTKYSGGWAYKRSVAISGTTDQALYQSQRTGNFSYSIPLANGNYNLTLKFAEIYFTAKGRRVFNVVVGGRTVVSRLDVCAVAGANKAYDVTVPVSVTNGTLRVQFQSVVDNAIVNAISVSK